MPPISSPMPSISMPTQLGLKGAAAIPLKGASNVPSTNPMRKPYFTFQDLSLVQPADVLVVLAHPDDELLLSGAVAELAQSGKNVQMVYATNGSAGQDVSGRNLSGDVLGETRSNEAAKALKVLGVHRPPLILDFMDGKTGDFPDALKAQLRAILLQSQPGMVLMYNPVDGMTGHPDHKNIANYLQDTLDALGSGQTPQDQRDRLKIENLLKNNAVYESFLPQSASPSFWHAFSPTDPSWKVMQFQPDARTDLRVFLPQSVLDRKSSSMQQHVSQYRNGDIQGIAGFYAEYPYESFTRYQIQKPQQPIFSTHAQQNQMPVSSPMNFLSFNTPGAQKPSSNQPIQNQTQTPWTTPSSPSFNPVEKKEYFAKSKQQPEPSTVAEAWKKIILFAPILGFLASSALITRSLPARLKAGMVNGALKAGGRAPMSTAQIDETLKSVGQKSLGFAVLLKSLGGISAGIVSGQPSMIWGNLIQLIPSGILAFKKSNAMLNFATSMEMLLGGFYTVGFANELKNKDPKTPPEKIRRYDMTRLKFLLKNNNGLSLEQRLTGLLSTMKSMAAFTIQDHLLLVKDLSQKAAHYLQQIGSPKGQPKPTLKSRLEEWIKEPSATKSQVAALFFYLGTLPILLLTRKNPKIGEKKAIVALKATGMTIANMAPFAIAFNRDDLRGKAPLIGAPLAVIGMANSRNPFFVGMGHLGESFNDVFFSDVAVNGVKTQSESQKTENTQ